MIPKVVFKFDKEKDLHNIWQTVNAKTSFGYDFKKNIPEQIIKICKNKEFNFCKKELNKKLKKLYQHHSIKIQIETLNKSWKIIEKEYFKRLEKITKYKFKFKNSYGYLTTFARCPYNYKIPYFYVNFFNSQLGELKTVGHELMHIHLHNSPWWNKVKEELGNQKTHDLKEALTELLNSEFRDLWIVDDLSYPNHIKLREYITKQWKREKNFEELTNKCIKWVKTNGVK
jgi:hypothetical protein